MRAVARITVAISAIAVLAKGSGPSIEDSLYMIRMPADCSFYTIYTVYTASSLHLHLYTARHLFV